MFIYVSGPYSAAVDEVDKSAAIGKNIGIANQCALDLAEKGHYPFVPHTMMRGWEDESHINRAQAMEIRESWVAKCDALFYIGDSPEAKEERAIAVENNMPIYRKIEDVPVVTTETQARLSPVAVNAYLVEYEQCMDSYRHTYATLWQAGGIFAAVSAAIIAFSRTSTNGDIPWWIELLAPLPVLFWWWGIFRPMNRYGEWRSRRLAAIEKRLSDGGAAPDVDMQHFRHFDSARRAKPSKTAKVTEKARHYLWKFFNPRVVTVVTMFGVSLLLLEILLVLNHRSKLADWFLQLSTPVEATVNADSATAEGQ